MKTMKTIVAVLWLALLLPAYAFSEGTDYMRVSYVAGDVQVNTPDTDEWGGISVNAPLGEGDQVWVPRGGRVELQLGSGSVIRLDQESALQILSMENGSSQFHLSQGSAYVVFDLSRKGGLIQFDTPDASTRAYKRAVFRIDVADQYTDVTVYRGSVETENGVGTTKIRKNQMLSLGQDTDGEVAPIGPPDEWEDWNKKRNDRSSESSDAAARYLPEELRTYAGDLDSNGRWVRVPDYGLVWVPTVTADSDWAPYRDGRWIWRHGEYVWVGLEAWGWAPYHYGRWAHVPGYGWSWIPPSKGEVYWGPGYVGWVRTAEYVAWVPLAPREIYYGRGNYGRHSVNITKVNVNQINITNVYKNMNVNKGVTVVNRNTFNTATPTVVKVNKQDLEKKIFVKNNFVAGNHDIKPTKASFYDPAKNKVVVAPPQAVRNVAVKDLKQARPFTKDAAKSVMNPGIKPTVLPVNAVAKPRTPGQEKPVIKPVIKPVRPADKGAAVMPQSGRTTRTLEPTKGQPAEKEKGKVTTPFGGPAAKDDRPAVKPERKGPAVPENIPAPRSTEQQRGQAVEKEKGRPTTPFGGPAGKDDKSGMKPERKGPAVPENVPAPRSTEQQKGQAVEKEKGRPTTPFGGPAAKDDRPAVKPERKGPAVPENIPAPRSTEQQRGQAVEKEKGRLTTPFGGPAVKEDKPAVKPAAPPVDKVKPVAPPVDKPKPAAPPQAVQPKAPKPEEKKKKDAEQEDASTPPGVKPKVR